MVHLHNTAGAAAAVVGAGRLVTLVTPVFTAAGHCSSQTWHWLQNCSWAAAAGLGGCQPSGRNPGPRVSALHTGVTVTVTHRSAYLARWYRVKLENRTNTPV